METALPNVKPEAYAVGLQLEPRVQTLAGGPHCIAWDGFRQRLLYVRDDWHYNVIAATSEVWDYGYIETVVCEYPAPALPSLEAGKPLCRVDRNPVSAQPGPIGPRLVDQLAVDRATGIIAAWSVRGDEAPPYHTTLHTWGPTGNPGAGAVVAQPNDGTPQWAVPHAICVDTICFAIERDTTHHVTIGPATGRVVRRPIGTIGTLSAFWSPADRYAYPHTVSLVGDNLFVFVNTLFNPETALSYVRTRVVALDPMTLEFRFFQELTFDFDEADPPNLEPYSLGPWEAAGLPNSGGVAIPAGAGAFNSVRYLASGITPNGFDPNPAVGGNGALFEFDNFAPGVWVRDLGDGIGTPLHRVDERRVVGCVRGELPQLREVGS